MAAHKFCLECANAGHSCCTHRTGGTFVTLHEAARIAGFLGKSPDEIAMFVKDEDLRDEWDFINFFNLFFREDGKIVPLAYRGRFW